MTKYDVINIHGHEFKCFHSIDQAKRVPYLPSYRTLSDAYTVPSKIKQEKYNMWCEWFKKMGATRYGVYSANRYRFTMGGEIKFLGAWYYVYISWNTKEKTELNELIPMEY